MFHNPRITGQGPRRLALALEHRHPTSPTRTGVIGENVLTLALTIFLINLGESLWKDFLPSYLIALGASVLAVSIFQALKDLLDAVYQYPGGRIADAYGRRNALIFFSVLALAGYAIYFLSPSWSFVFIGLFFVMAFSSLFQPAIFATIGDNMPSEVRATGFSLESILRRAPLLLGPALGGLAILTLQTRDGWDLGLLSGVRAGMAVSIFLTAMALLLQYVFYSRDMGHNDHGGNGHRGSYFRDMGRIFGAMPRSLRRLLISDSLARFGENTAKVLIILLATDAPPLGLGINTFQFGLLVTIQMVIAILSYAVPARLSHLYGRRPFTAATLGFFSLFPLILFLSANYYWLLAAFVIAGLREMGEPTRKTMIVDLSPEEDRARAVGVYYTLRGLAIFPAGFLGGALWLLWPRLPFLISSLVAAAGFILFAFGTGREYPKATPGDSG